MPTYEYQCSKCGHVFEQFQSMSDKPLTVCPKGACPKRTWGKGKVNRVIGAGAGLIFKGSGFYITDYRSDNYKEAAKQDSKPSAGSGDSKAGGESGASTKPAATGDAGKSKKASPAKKSKE